MNYWWTSDYHFGHFNIIRYCGRPFETVEEMDKVIIRKHNERVKPEDTVFFLGDFIFKGGKEGGEERCRAFEKKLNGKVVFIEGNHDRNVDVLMGRSTQFNKDYQTMLHIAEMTVEG